MSRIKRKAARIVSDSYLPNDEKTFTMTMITMMMMDDDGEEQGEEEGEEEEEETAVK